MTELYISEVLSLYPSAVLFLDKKGGILRYNSKFADFFTEAGCGEIADLKTVSDLPPRLAALTEKIIEKESFSRQITVGKQRLEVKLQAGKFLQIIEIKDVSEQKSRQEDLSRALSRIELLIAEMPVCFLVLEEKNVASVNPKFTELTGYDLAGINELGFINMLLPTYRKTLRSLIKNGRSDEALIRISTFKNHELDIKVVLAPATDSFSGRKELLIFLLDVSDIKRQSRALETANRKLAERNRVLRSRWLQFIVIGGGLVLGVYGSAERWVTFKEFSIIEEEIVRQSKEIRDERLEMQAERIEMMAEREAVNEERAELLLILKKSNAVGELTEQNRELRFRLTDKEAEVMFLEIGTEWVYDSLKIWQERRYREINDSTDRQRKKLKKEGLIN